ncbi:MAG: hypothetical protein JO266_22365 [Acidobacteria bacterium]|nr:hypothetical protein [Acidobacteriota bacterium]MBV9480619.1 hypothetical protein [Acidobacteriota bacterium]
MFWFLFPLQNTGIRQFDHLDGGKATGIGLDTKTVAPIRTPSGFLDI